MGFIFNYSTAWCGGRLSKVAPAPWTNIFPRNESNCFRAQQFQKENESRKQTTIKSTGIQMATGVLIWRHGQPKQACGAPGKKIQEQGEFRHPSWWASSWHQLRKQQWKVSLQQSWTQSWKYGGIEWVIKAKNWIFVTGV